MKTERSSARKVYDSIITFLRRCIFNFLSVGPLPDHIAFIMDGNRRFAKKLNLVEGEGHKAGYASLISMLRYCYELGIKYITVYAFSIENFKRKPEEVQLLMDLMLEKIDELLKEESVVSQYGIRLHFIGNLKLLNENVRHAVEKAMKATAHNDKAVLLICVAYTSCDEIMHAIHESGKEKIETFEASSTSEACNGTSSISEENRKINGIQEYCTDELNESQPIEEGHSCDDKDEGSTCVIKRNGLTEHDFRRLQKDKCNGAIGVNKNGEEMQESSLIKVMDIEKHMYMAVAPDPDIVIRSSGETRLSNFLLWQTAYSTLYSPAALWPEMGFWHLVWAVLDYQRNYSYLQKKRKQL